MVRVDDAVQVLLDQARRQPDDAAVYKALGMIYLNEKQAKEYAMRFLYFVVAG